MPDDSKMALEELNRLAMFGKKDGPAERRLFDV